jgi:hypothetical protein
VSLPLHTSLVCLSADSSAYRRLSNGRMVLDMVVVHPRYWSRGHGKALASG